MILALQRLLSNWLGNFSFIKSAWQSVELSEIGDRQTLGFLIFEYFVEAAPDNFGSEMIEKSENLIESIPNDERFEILISEILNDQNIYNNCFQLGNCQDPSLLIGALAQIIEIGAGELTISEKANLCPLLTRIVKIGTSELIESQWDFITCSLTEWLETACENLENENTAANSCLLTGCMRLLEALSKFFTSPSTIVDPS